MYYMYGVSGPSLLIESTDSMIILSCPYCIAGNFRGRTLSWVGRDQSEHFAEKIFMEC